MRKTIVLALKMVLMKQKFEYYNPNTGTNSYYTLDVEVADNSVTVIHFPNGGWLDDTHIISGGELNEDWTTTLETDKGYIYTITINR